MRLKVCLLRRCALFRSCAHDLVVSTNQTHHVLLLLLLLLCCAEAEAAFNLGRASHAVGLLHLAVAHYERVLELADEHAVHDADVANGAADDVTHQMGRMTVGAAGGAVDAAASKCASHTNDAVQRVRAAASLSREAAHNLALIYRGSGAPELARRVLRRYLTV
jgi:hypothetical protein